MRLDKDREEPEMEASKYTPKGKGKERKGGEGKENKTMAQKGPEW